MLKSIGKVSLWIFVFVCTYAFAKFQGGYSAWFLFFATSVIGLYVFLTHRFAGRGLSSKRRVSSTKLTAGGSLEVDIEIRNAAKWPLPWLVVEDIVPHRLLIQGSDHRRMFFPGFEKRIRMKYVIPNMQRGKYMIQETVLRTGDIFGFGRHEFVQKHYDDITVYPKTVPLQNWHTVNRFNSGMSYAQNRMAEDTANVLGVRDYTPGDRLSRIHWRATARTGSIKSKEFELHVTNDLMFFYNRSKADYPAGSGQAFESSVSIVASLIRYGLEKKYSVGLVSYGKEQMILPLSRNQDHYIRILEHLALVQPDADQQFSDVILKESHYLSRGCTAVLVTPVLTEDIVKVSGFLEYRKIKTELFLLKPMLNVSEIEQQLIGRAAVFGITVYIVGSEQELADAVRGPSGHVAIS